MHQRRGAWGAAFLSGACLCLDGHPEAVVQVRVKFSLEGDDTVGMSGTLHELEHFPDFCEPNVRAADEVDRYSKSSLAAACRAALSALSAPDASAIMRFLPCASAAA